MSNLTHSFGNGTGSGNLTLLENPSLCTLETCDMTLASFLYIPNLAGNTLYAVIFGILALVQIFLGIRHKTWGYMVAMVFGLILEIIGYAARIMLHNDPFNNDDFLMYLITLTIAPAFLSAAIYLCLSRIVIVYGADLSRFKPRTYTIFFCTCDFISLLLQAAGGAIAASSDTTSDSNLGKNIMLAGLGFQVASLTAFGLCGADFAFRVYRSNRNTRNNNRSNSDYGTLVTSGLFRCFLLGLVVATVAIFVRSVYRCVELSGGFNGDLFIKDEALFMVLEGVMIVIACTCLTVLHPAICFQGAWHRANFRFRPGRYAAMSSTTKVNEESGGSSTELFGLSGPNRGMGGSMA